MSAMIGDVTRETADGIILAYPIPDAVIGTRERDGDDWCVGTKRDPRHGHWLARTGGRRRDREIVVRFDTVVDVGGTRLGFSDALTKKVLVLAWLAGTLLRPRVNARRLRGLANAFDWLVRHRLSVGVTRNSELGPQHFRDFMERAKTGSLLDLVPVERRMEGAASAVAGDDQLVVGESDQPIDGNGVLRRPAVLAKRLGVTGQSLWCRADPKDAREHLGGGECRLSGRPGADERLVDRGSVPAPDSLE